MEAVQWFNVKYGMNVSHDIPRFIADTALTLASVSQQWRNFVLKDTHLWSQILIDTDDPGSLEHLQVYLHLSRTTTLLIVLRGWNPLSGIQLKLLMQESYRIGILVHPHNQPCIRFDDMTSIIRDSPETLSPFTELEIYSGPSRSKPSKSFLYPPCVHTLRLYGFCPYSMMSALLSFKQLSELSIDIFPPDEGMTSQPLMPVVLPMLQTLVFGIRWWSKGDWKLSRLVSCPSLKTLQLNARSQFNAHPFQVFAMMLNDLTCFPLLGSLECTLNLALSQVLSINHEIWFRESPPSDIQPRVPINLHHVSLHVARRGGETLWPDLGQT